MYRDVPDPLLVTPGEGVGGIHVGGATPDDVLARFGGDAKIDRHADGVYQINYDYRSTRKYDPRRDAQLSRPCKFEFEFGLLKAIEVGVYQKALYTLGDVRIRSSRRDVIEVFGGAFVALADGDRETLRYLDRGIELVINDHDDLGVVGFTVFRGRR